MRALSGLPHVVALGGGHGLSASLEALRRVTTNLTAVVTVADDGGSSGRLRREFDILPPGDLRMALAALCGDDEEGRVWADVLQSRFGGEGVLAGHAIGNLLIAGIWERLGSDPVSGLDMVGKLLDVQGRVLPMATVPLEIEADVIGVDPRLPDEPGLVRGQENVALASGEVRAVRLIPPDPTAAPQALEAIAHADYVVLGPGSWFSSVMPHLLVPQVAQALRDTPARRFLTLNLTPDDETQGYSAAEHLEFLSEHAPWLRLDAVIVDPSFARDDTHLAAYAASFGADVVTAHVRMSDGSPRHDPNRLASVYADLMSR